MRNKIFYPLVFISLLLLAPTLAMAKVVAFLGDSLTEGYGVKKENAYPALLGTELKKRGFNDVQILNSSISGSTSASAPARMQVLLKSHPDIVVLALGANDGLRGIDAAATRKYLTAAVKLAKTNSVKVLLVGMKVPPNFGLSYARSFEKTFTEIAAAEKLPLVPFLLEGVGGNPKLNIEDGIHPNELGHQKMAQTILPKLLKLL